MGLAVGNSSFMDLIVFGGGVPPDYGCEGAGGGGDQKGGGGGRGAVVWVTVERLFQCTQLQAQPGLEAFPRRWVCCTLGKRASAGMSGAVVSSPRRALHSNCLFRLVRSMGPPLPSSQ